MEKNPFLEQENYYEGYNENIDKLKNQPEVVQFDKLCYETFEANEHGKKLLEYAKERFIVYSQITRGESDYPMAVVWQEGFRDAYRMILQRIISHKQRIKAGENK